MFDINNYLETLDCSNCNKKYKNECRVLGFGTLDSTTGFMPTER
jgi:hypothetical protein